jgi:hypothetical protein
LLDRTRPATDNPFSHERVKTHQPRDLWESLLKLAVILFVLDVGVRRIQLDRDEWLKATATLRKWVFFWKGAPRPMEAEESLAALLARRDQVRAGRPAATAVARPELFQPEQAGAPSTEPAASPRKTPPQPPPTTVAEAEATSPEQPATTTSRLLEAKRRAQRRRE